MSIEDITIIGAKFRSDWQELEKHETEVQAALKETCVLNDKGQVCQYNGKDFWEKMDELGHSSTIYGECKCKAKRSEYLTIEQMEERGIPTGK